MPEDEPVSAPLPYFDFEFEQYTLDKKILRDLILDEILIYHNPKAKKQYEEYKRLYPNGVLEMIYYRKDEDECWTSTDAEGYFSTNSNSPN